MLTNKHTKMYKHTGTLTYYFNEFDNHDKVLEFDVLWGSPMTANDLKLKVLEDYQHVLGLAQKIGTLTYTTELILMGAE